MKMSRLERLAIPELALPDISRLDALKGLLDPPPTLGERLRALLIKLPILRFKLQT